MGLHCPVEVGSPSSRAGSTLKAYPRAGTPSWPLRTYGHVHEKHRKCVPHDVGENVWVLRRAVARPAAWNSVWQCCICLAPGWGVSGLVGSGSHHGSGLCLVQLLHPQAKEHPQTLRSEHRPRLQRWVWCTHRRTSKVMPGVGGGARRSVLGVLSRLGVDQFGPSTSGGMPGCSVTVFPLPRPHRQLGSGP